MPSRTTWNGRSLVSTWRCIGMSRTCSDATGFSLMRSRFLSPCSPRKEQGLRKGASSDSSCGGADDVEDVVGVGEHGDVAAIDVVGGGAHPLGRGPLQVRLDGLVVVTHDAPARLGPP